MRERRVVIVGGGITGLTTAYRLLKSRRDASGSPIRVTVLEAKPRLGGNIRTERAEGCVIDAGPDSFVTARPHATALCRELGLADRLIGTTERNRRVYVRRGGVLHPLPEGLVLTVPSRVMPLARSGLFSLVAKARMGLDLVLPKRTSDQDESIGGFIRRRLGQEALDRLAEPLLGGIYAGNVDTLSLRATFPQLLDLEHKHGSLIMGAVAQRKAQEEAKKKAPQGSGFGSVFYSLLGGMGEIVTALSESIEALGAEVIIGAEVSSVTHAESDGRLAVRFTHAGEQRSIPAEDVILATPAYVTADALDGLDRAISAELRQIPYVSTATIVLGYPRADVPHPLDATGLIVPKSEQRRALAATFISSKWAGRAPSDMALLRIFAGGYRDPAALSLNEEELVAMAREELAALLGIKVKPSFSRVYRYERSNAQPVVGHLDRMKRLRALSAQHPGLHLTGAAYDGVGIPDCVRQAGETAQKILENKAV